MSNLDVWGRDLADTFMYRDLARSGLVPSDFPLGATELPPNAKGQAQYRFQITADYWKVRINRAEDKYFGPSGIVPPIATFGEFHGAKLTATVEGYKKALLFHITTGIPTIVLDGCWAFGEQVEDNQLARVKNLSAGILDCLTPGQDHLVFFDGDWATNEMVRNALATYRVLLEEFGVNARFKDLGANDKGRLGYDDWFVGEYGTDRSTWPTPDAVLLRIAVVMPAVDPRHLLGGALSFMLGNVDRLANEFLDLNDRGTGSLIIKLIGAENLRYLRDTGEWVRWTHVKSVGAWRWVNLGVNPIELVVVAAQHYYARAVALEGLAARCEAQSEKAANALAQAKIYKAFASGPCSNTIPRGNIIKDMANGGRREIYALSSDFDNKSYMLGVANGVIDLRTGELREETQADMVTRHATVPYVVNPSPIVGGGRDIEKFLRSTLGAAHGVEDPEFYSYMQRRLGIALWGGNRLQSFEIWQGNGSDGKSALALMVQGALGDSKFGGYAAGTKPEVIMSNYRAGNPEGASPFLVLLRGARMVFASETKDNSALNEALIKQLSGGERLLARANYQEGGSFKVDFTFFLMTNPMPACHSLDGAMLSRLAVLPFKVQWQRTGAQYKLDEHLPPGDPWWVEDAGEDLGTRTYILWWLVQGCATFFKERENLGPLPSRCLDAIMSYKDEADTISHWMAECGVSLAQGERTLVGELYASYSNFVKGAGNQPLSTVAFIKRMVNKFPGQVERVVLTDNKRGLKGITMAKMKF